MSNSFVLAIDQGTSSTKSLIFNEEGKVVARASEPLKTSYLDDGFVEQDPIEIYQNVLQSVEKCLHAFKVNGGDLSQLRTCGISNQRETFIVWDEKGIPLYNAVVWQCKRSIAICERLKKDGLQDSIRKKTGLVIDPYFSGSKLIWLKENVEKVRQAIDRGQAYFGTVDTWLLFKLTQGKSYLTDYTNASRTLFFNLNTLKWDADLLKTFQLSTIKLPDLKPSACVFGESDFNGLLEVPISITSMIGDSHAAAFGEGCFSPGTAKATLGTGCSILMNTGSVAKESEHGMVTTICWSTEDRVDYAVEGVIVSCGATVEWLKNEMGLFTHSTDTEALAKAVPDNGGVYIIPAFSGLGAPYWQMNRKASIAGLTFGSTKNHLIRAALESIVFQIKDVITAMEQDTGIALKELMVNGGITSNRFVLRTLTDLLGKVVSNKKLPDISAQGAAYLAGLKAGVYKDLKYLENLMIDASKIQPDQNNVAIQKAHANWKFIIENGR